MHNNPTKTFELVYLGMKASNDIHNESKKQRHTNTLDGRERTVGLTLVTYVHYLCLEQEFVVESPSVANRKKKVTNIFGDLQN